MIYNSLPQKKTSNASKNFSVRNSTLCNSKEFFYTSNNKKEISEEEYKDALNYIENMDTVYFSMNKIEKRMYKKNLDIIKEYHSQIK
ncbi:MAG: hypothetical protein K6F04_03720 [bacterium]|nr:hypothetical protein [bacterium]